ncbi:hypothetical protein ACVWVU_002394 [Thermostichus sp. OS-CIW-18]|uniref:hypothetical protein n=2 Tax=Synechococcus TaxID=1129 RepID=UPI0039C001A8
MGFTFAEKTVDENQGFVPAPGGLNRDQIRLMVDNFFNKSFCNLLANLESGFAGFSKNFCGFLGGLDTRTNDSLRNGPANLADKLACIEDYVYNFFANLGRSFEDRLKNVLHGQ